MHPDVIPQLRSLIGAAEVVAVRRVGGGADAATWRVALAGAAPDVIVQQYPAGTDVAARLVAVLRSVGGRLDGLVPEVIAADPLGSGSSPPTVVTSALPGTSGLVTGAPLVRAAELGRTLARIHACPLDRLTGLDLVLSRPGGSVETIVGPEYDALRAAWPDLAREPVVLTHYDYWSGNALWRKDTLTGVVDWSGAGLAPRGFDIGWCRLDLYLLHGPEAPDAFLEAYQQVTGSGVHAVGWWDLVAAGHASNHIESWTPNYADLGRADLAPEVLRRKLDEWVAFRVP